MTTNEVIENLKQEAKKSKVANDIFTVWAMRKRARFEVTIDGLEQRMNKEGFKYSRADYAQILKLMAKLGLGRLETDSSGKVKSLKQLNITLQSIGQAALGEKMNLTSLKLRNKYKDLPVPRAEVKDIAPRQNNLNLGAVSLTVEFNGKNVVVPIPQDLTSEEIGALIKKFHYK